MRVRRIGSATVAEVAVDERLAVGIAVRAGSDTDSAEAGKEAAAIRASGAIKEAKAANGSRKAVIVYAPRPHGEEEKRATLRAIANVIGEEGFAQRRNVVVVKFVKMPPRVENGQKHDPVAQAFAEMIIRAAAADREKRYGKKEDPCPPLRDPNGRIKEDGLLRRVTFTFTTPEGERQVVIPSARVVLGSSAPETKPEARRAGPLCWRCRIPMQVVKPDNFRAMDGIVGWICPRCVSIPATDEELAALTKRRGPNK